MIWEVFSNLNDPVIPRYQVGGAIFEYYLSMKLNPAVQYVTVLELMNWDAAGNNSDG